MQIIHHLSTSVRALALLTIATGLAYPALTTMVVQSAFPAAVRGTLLIDSEGHVVGSELIGQNFQDPKFLWGRLSATSPQPYNASASSGSNYGVDNPALIDAVKARVDALKAADPDNTLPVPVDLVTASGSGLDPDISPAAAIYQVHRIAKARSLSDNTVRAVIDAAIVSRTFGLFGEPRVNVLKVNLALDRLAK
jgi:potassium-transporting ATPase KdpC subunit